MESRNSKLLILFMIMVFAVLMWSYISTEYENGAVSETETSDLETFVYRNAWIVRLSKGEALIYADGSFHRFAAESSAKISEVLADVTVADGRVAYVVVKDDVIEGRVLAVSEDSIEIEGYGKLKVAYNAAILKNYGEFKEMDIRDIAVGCTMRKIIVADGEVCAIIMDEPFAAEVADTIRVLIMTDDYGEYYHEKVLISSDLGLSLKYGEKIESYGEGVILSVGETFFDEADSDRIIVSSSDENGRIKLNSVKRRCGNPEYRGRIELVKTTQGIIVINELPIEEYLYSVVSGEMPVSYGTEALKVQAVCARSYAYKQILEGKLSEYGAHVNDSSQYQVYNNAGEYAEAIRAVDETRGQIMTYKGEIVEAYYFSTSCGHTTDAEAVWGGQNPEYIKGKLINGNNSGLLLDTEEKFAEFIKNKNYESYDMDYDWYRWEVEFSKDTINKLLKKAGLYDKVGNITGMEVVERKTGGIVSMLKVMGDKGSVLLEKEYTIRQFLSPEGIEIVKNDGSTVKNFIMLPSAYFTIEETDGNSATGGYHIYGGGFGHGAGMSQKGAKKMVDSGFSYDEVLAYFYNGITITDCYYK